LIDRGSGTFHVEAPNTTGHARPPTYPGLIQVDVHGQEIVTSLITLAIFFQGTWSLLYSVRGQLEAAISNEYNRRAPFSGFSTN
jgi:hypothetical protein